MVIAWFWLSVTGASRTLRQYKPCDASQALVRHGLFRATLQTPVRISRIEQHDHRRDEKYRTEAVTGGYSRAQSRTGDVPDIAERLIVAEHASGNLIGTVINQQRLHGGKQCAIAGTQQKAQNTEL